MLIDLMKTKYYEMSIGMNNANFQSFEWGFIFYWEDLKDGGIIVIDNKGFSLNNELKKIMQKHKFTVYSKTMFMPDTYQNFFENALIINKAKNNYLELWVRKYSFNDKKTIYNIRELLDLMQKMKRGSLAYLRYIGANMHIFDGVLWVLYDDYEREICIAITTGTELTIIEDVVCRENSEFNVIIMMLNYIIENSNKVLFRTEDERINNWIQENANILSSEKIVRVVFNEEK